MRNKTRIALIATVGTLFTGCRIISGTVWLCTVLVVGVAGAVGFTVYKTGETVYDGGKAVVSAVGDTGSAASNSVSEGYNAIVISQGTFKVKRKNTVKELYDAFMTVLERAGFKITSNKYDELAGIITADTVMKEKVLVKFKLIDENATALEFRIGKGDLKQSEYLYNQAIAELPADDNKGEE